VEEPLRETRGVVCIVAVVAAMLLIGLIIDVPLAGATAPGRNGMIAFDSLVHRVGFRILTINPDGTALSDPLPSKTSNLPAVNPGWTPDGNRIEFRRQPSSPGEPSVLYSMDLNGGTVMPLLQSGDSDVTWSPDGSRVAFQSNGDIYTANADGTGRTDITNTPAPQMEGVPSWSPDGRKLVFEADNWPSIGELRIINVDGTGLTHLFGPNAFNPDWAPDGHAILFANPTNPAGVYKINVDGSGLTTLVSPGGVAGPANSLASPRWSPDGTEIAFDDVLDVYVMAADGSRLRKLTNTPAETKNRLAWQRCVPGVTVRCTSVAARSSVPKLKLGGPRREHIGKKGRIRVSARCDVACRVSAFASVHVAHLSKRYKTRRLKKKLPAGKAVNLKLKFSTKTARGVRHALARLKLTADVRIVASNEGGRTAAKRRIRLVR
jgi:Tol biopolymer transport system component